MPLIWICSSFFGGLLVADVAPNGHPAWLLLCGISLFFLLLRFILPSWLDLDLPWLSHVGLGWACVLAFSLGGIRYRASLPDFQDPSFIANYTDAERGVIVTGVVREFPDVRDQTTILVVHAEQIRYPGAVRHQDVSGKILAWIPLEGQVQYGDRVVLTGLLREPPDAEEFSYRDYLARKNIHAYMPRARVGILESGGGDRLLRWIYSLKRTASSMVYRLWPDPEASLLSGILLGDEGRIPDPVEKAFQDTGTAHIIAISGFNITIVAGLFTTTFGRILRPGWSVLVSVIGIGIYTVLVGADPAVMRAAWMGGLAMFARQIGRRSHGLNAAAVASMVMAVINPHIPWDVSFQLSLAATLGLLLYAQPMADWFQKTFSAIVSTEWAKKAAEPVSEYVLFTLAAQLTTFPVLLYHFQRFSWISFLANPVILPAQPAVMILGGLAVILGMIWLPVGKIAAALVYPFISYTIRVVEFSADLQGAVIHTLNLSVIGVVLVYLALLVVTLKGEWLVQLKGQIKPSLLVAALFMGNILVWRAYFFQPDGQLHLSFFEVGTGSAILIQTPEGHRVLINGGPSSSALADGLGRRLPLLDREVEILVVASPLKRDIGALPPFVDRNPPGQVLWLGDPSPSRAADALRGKIKEHQIDVVEGDQGMVLEIEEKLNLEILSETDQGGILLLTYGHFRSLLPFGISDKVIERLRNGRDIGTLSLYFVGDNGHRASNPVKWIRNLNPQLAVLSVAPDDPYGLPSLPLLGEMAGYSLLRTDVHGTIEITTDGERMWISVDRFP